MRHRLTYHPQDWVNIMELPNQHHNTTAAAPKLTQLRAGFSKLLSATQATAKRCMSATAAERKAQLRAQLAMSYRLMNADELLPFLKKHKYLLPLLDCIPGKILTVMAAEPETVHGIELEYFQDDDGDEVLSILVNANIDDVDRTLEVSDALFTKVLEPLYDQANGKILIRVAIS